jgi:DNA-binding response OmpR family regulator
MPQEHERTNDCLLVIDDDLELCTLLGRFLKGEGFEVETVQDGRLGAERALSGAHALIVLDVTMPEANGFEVLRRIREVSQTPVLMLTARGDARDRILGLETGADDYLPKPFDPQELAARIRAILRRSRVGSRPGGHPPPLLVVDDIELDAGARVVRRAGHAIDLTTVEFELLERFLRAAGAVVSREDLTREVLERQFSPFDRSIDTHVYNLRRKIGRLTDGTERIKGIRGVGYLYAASGRTDSKA